MSTWWGDSKNMEEIEFSQWLFEGRLRQGKNVLPDGLNWLCYFAGSSKSHHIFGIPSSSRHEKCWQILQTLFWVFQYSRNSQCTEFTKTNQFICLLVCFHGLLWIIKEWASVPNGISLHAIKIKLMGSSQPEITSRPWEAWNRN